MKLKLEAVGNRLVVKPVHIDEEIKTETGVKLYYSQQTVAAEEGANDRGTIVSMGPYCWDDYEGKWAKVGDQVMWPRYAGRQVETPDGMMFILNCQDVLCKWVEV